MSLGDPHQEQCPDQSIVLLRKLRDVTICARGTKIYGYRSLLLTDPYFAEMFKINKTEYHTNEDPDRIRQHIERIYFGQSSRTATTTTSSSINTTGSQSIDKNSRSCSLTSSREALDECRKFPFEKSIAVNEFPLNEAMELDKRLLKHFEEEQTFGHNTYLLLDPFISEDFGSGNSVAVQIFNSFFKFSKLTRDNYYRIAIEQVNMEIFKRFISSIFFVGHCAHNQLNQLHSECKDSLTIARKSSRISQIQNGGKGPVWLLCFSGISRKEALYRQSLMIQAIGLHNLTNNVLGHKCFDFELNEEKRIIAGTYLLLKSFLKFVANGQRQQKSSITQHNQLLSQILFDASPE